MMAREDLSVGILMKLQYQNICLPRAHIGPRNLRQCHRCVIYLKLFSSFAL